MKEDALNALPKHAPTSERINPSTITPATGLDELSGDAGFNSELRIRNLGDDYGLLLSDVPDSHVSAPGEITADHIARFQRRYWFHLIVSFAIMLLVFVMFGVAIYVFLFAQDIDSSKGSVEALLEIQTAMKGQESLIHTLEVASEGVRQEGLVGTRTVQDVLSALKDLGEAKTKLSLLHAKEQLLVSLGYYTDLDSIATKEELSAQKSGIQQYEKSLDSTQHEVHDRFRVGEVTRTDVAMVQGDIYKAKLNENLADQKLQFAPAAAQARQKRSNLDTLALIRTSLVRFGGVGVILFLISILVPIYRYNVRLATFYLARADSLTLSKDVRVDDFGQLTNLLTPAILFDKEPRTPIETVSALVKDAASLAKKP
jgi:hypothetical protein